MKRVQVEIALGTLLILATSIVVLIYGLNEQQRMPEQEQASHGRAIEAGATLYEAQCSRCHGVDGRGIPGLCPPLNDRYFFDQRLLDVNWSGTMEDYIVATASSGRLASTRPELFPGQGTPAMPSFADYYGGPLREDQIRNIAAFIMNWESTATLVEGVGAPSEGATVGTDINKALPEGDPQAGEALAAQLCAACHIAAPVGPAWLPTAESPGVGARAATTFTSPEYNGKAISDVQYLFESIVATGAYLVPGFADGVMPKTYGEQLTDQQMADLIAYLLTLK